MGTWARYEPSLSPISPLYKIKPFTIFLQGLNNMIQWCMQECFINCGTWDGIITVLLGRVDTFFLGFVSELGLEKGRRSWYFSSSYLGLLKSSRLLLDSKLIKAWTIHLFNTYYFGTSNLLDVLCDGNTSVNEAYNWYGLFSLSCGPPRSKKPMPCFWNMTLQSTKDEATPAHRGEVAQCITYDSPASWCILWLDSKVLQYWNKMLY